MDQRAGDARSIPNGHRQGRGRPSSLRLQLALITALPLVALVFGAAVAIQWTAAGSGASDVNRANDRIHRVDRVVSAVLDVEAAARGFALTGDEGFLIGFEDRVESLDGTVEALRQTGSDDPVLAQGSDDVAVLVAARVELVRQLIATARSGEEVTPLLVQGLEVTQEIRAQADELHGHLEQQRERALAVQDRSRTTAIGIGIGALALGLSAMAVLVAVLLRRTLRRLARLQANARRLEHGQPLERGQPRDDELGEVEWALNHAADRLAERESRLRETAEFHQLLVAEGPLVVVGASLRVREDEAQPLDRLDFRATYVSPNIERILDISTEQLRTTASWAELTHPDDLAAVAPQLVRLLEGEEVPIQDELRLLGRDGRYRQVAVSLARAEDGDRVFVYLLDVTARRAAEEQAEERRALLQAVLDTSRSPIYAKDLQGRYLLANAAHASLLGRAPRDLAGRTDTELDDVLVGEWESLDRLVALSRRPRTTEVTVRAAQGQQVLLTVRTPMVDGAGRTLGMCGVAADITERSRFERELAEARRAADRANRAKSEFLSRMSHELRTPLNSVLGFAQLLELGDLDPDEQSSVEQILVAGRHLLDLIEEVLDIARIESGRLRLSLEPVSLAEVIDVATDLTQVLATGAGVSIEAPTEADWRRLHVRGDRQRVLEVLLNLLSNAVKYNRPGGHIRLGCRAERSRVVVEVRDDGIGIPAGSADLVFEPFERLGWEATAIEGTGVGLPLSKGLTEAMGGRMGFSSTEGEGSTFWFELDEAEPPAAPTPTEAPQVVEPVDDARPLDVLYVEDNLANQQLMARVVALREGITLHTASVGAEGLAMAEDLELDLVLLDVHLPDMRGDEILTRLRAGTRHTTTPVAIVSADAATEQQQRYLRMGADFYLAKPIDVSQILALLDRIRAGEAADLTGRSGTRPPAR